MRYLAILTAALIPVVNGAPNPAWQQPRQIAETSASGIVSSSGPAETGSVSISSLAPSPTNNGTSDACARVSRLSRAFARTERPSATPTVPAELAYECINSVPFESDAAVELMDSIRPYLYWQTTLQYVKDPPTEYAEKIQAPYDFYAEWERIYDKAKAGSYDNEYLFGFDLYKSFQRAHDGHFVYYPDSVTLIFSFARTTPLVSVSKDGTSIPEVYVYSDVLATSSGNASFTPSPLTQINGEDSTDWLLDFSENGSLQDKDALWNNVFYVPAQVSLGAAGSGTGTFSGGGRGRWIYPGPTTTLTFANGTTVTNQNYANVLSSFHNIQSGADLRRTYFTPPRGEPEPVESIATISSSSSIAAPTPITTTIPAPGYPSPFIREPNNLNSGYFLEGEGYDDVAVLAVPSFVGTTDDELPFQEINTYFLNEAVAMGKKKLIIDVSANGGGTILQGYDLFKQLFPSILPYGATRFRAHEAFNIVGKEISYYSGLVPRSLRANATAENRESSSWNYRTDVDIDYNNFPNWPAKYANNAYGPQPDYYTSIVRWNLSDVLTPDQSGGIYVSGYLRRRNITMQPFEAENIVVVYDGYCASTCTIFSEFMRQQAGVKTVALGGRPTKDIIQAVGGVKGTNDFPYDYILYGVTQPFKINHYHNDSYYGERTVLEDYNDLPLYRGTAYVVNSRDGIREGDESQTPLQFRYEPADCRVYYTPEMTVDQSAVWRTVADTAFNGIDHCVAGNYPKTKRDFARKPMSKHGIRWNLDIEEHYAAMAEVWTGKDDITLGGDGIMIP